MFLYLVVMFIGVYFGVVSCSIAHDVSRLRQSREAERESALALELLAGRYRV